MKDIRTKYVCIHGHFYQPPRENPWLEAIEREDSASPYHDWNERINAECYRANTAARLVCDDNKILRLSPNYRYFSFNFGPTLLHWLEHKDPWVYRHIIDSDKESCRVHDGHGNAIAQVYNHVIMPLANERDKVTQVHWGIRDFELRFGRRPEGMWLAETAVDRKTLSVLADAGIKFTILSPYQAASWRFIGKGNEWCDVRGGRIPTGRAYRYDCGDGKYIHIFFYDAELARGVAFECLLEHSSRFLGQIECRFESSRDAANDEPFLVNTATDGESYGHHFKFGDMALAASFVELDRDPGAEVTNYASFLSSFPVVAEVEIFENTAWSCSHGLGRWSADCGCHIGGEPGWSQKWRAPLREALNFVRDALAAHFEKEMKKLCNDPWKARNDYINVVLGKKGYLDEFLLEHLGTDPGAAQTTRMLELLEMQRFCLLMFTSCGWFFDEISELEAVLLLKYACRAMQLAEQTGAEPIEEAFLEILERAPSNAPEYGNGANVYLRKVKPAMVNKDRVAANYAIHSLVFPSQRQLQMYTYSIMPEREEDLGANPVPCLYGHLKVKDARTFSEEEFLYAVLHFGGLDFRCSVKPYAGKGDYGAILDRLQNCIEEQSTNQMLRVLDKEFGTDYYGLNDVFKDLRSSIVSEISKRTIGTYADLHRSLYQTYKPLINSLKQWGIAVPADLQVSSQRVLSEEADQLIRRILAHETEAPCSPDPWDATDFFFRAHIARLNALLEEAKSWKVSLQLEAVSRDLGKAAVESATRLIGSLKEKEAGRLFR
ncbi:MAG: DUF3536 domain-containing protein, partial [Syntrophobacter sp.]